MYRTHSNGELNASHINTQVTLAGWVQKIRNKGFSPLLNYAKESNQIIIYINKLYKKTPNKYSTNLDGKVEAVELSKV